VHHKRSRQRRRRHGAAFGRVFFQAALLVALVAIIGELFASIPPAMWPVVVLLAISLVCTGVWIFISGKRQARKARVAHFQTLGNLLVLSPTQFEEAIADLFRQLGYREVSRVGGAGDLGVDITARDPQGHSIIIQCKRYAPGVQTGSPDIQRFLGTLVTVHHADRGIFVTTSSFTEPARQLAHGRIELIDGPALTALAARAVT
jgi:HJR/Mrr/RecB family endonuclease